MGLRCPEASTSTTRQLTFAHFAPNRGRCNCIPVFRTGTVRTDRMGRDGPLSSSSQFLSFYFYLFIIENGPFRLALLLNAIKAGGPAIAGNWETPHCLVSSPLPWKCPRPKEEVASNNDLIAISGRFSSRRLLYRGIDLFGSRISLSMGFGVVAFGTGSWDHSGRTHWYIHR